MTGVLLATIACLLMLCAALVFLLIGRDQGAQREENRLHQIAAGLAEQLTTERQKVRHLQERVTGYRAEVSRLSADNGQLRERNTDLRDQLHAQAAGEPSLTEAFTAWIAEQPTTEEREYPR